MSSDTLDIHERLAARHQIAHIWSIEDVQLLRPDLTDEQAWEILQAVKHQCDACVGINWDVISQIAHDLYAPSPTTHSKGN